MIYHPAHPQQTVHDIIIIAVALPFLSWAGGIHLGPMTHSFNWR